MSEITFFAHGKLLITGEYTVLDGATALAIPTKQGQRLTVNHALSNNFLEWVSVDHSQKAWFSAAYNSELEIIQTSDLETAQRLSGILKEIQKLAPHFKELMAGKVLTTYLDFDRQWGLGTSSTLISLLAQYLQVNPYRVLKNTFGGSGYDLACATSTSPILYQMGSHFDPIITPVSFHPAQINRWFFVYLGKKQISRSEIAKYSTLQFDRREVMNEISKVTRELISAEGQEEQCRLLELHEEIMSGVLGVPPIKKQFFPTIQGTFKSLGAWGGDMVLFIGAETEVAKIKALGYATILPWKELIHG